MKILDGKLVNEWDTFLYFITEVAEPEGIDLKSIIRSQKNEDSERQDNISG